MKDNEKRKRNTSKTRKKGRKGKEKISIISQFRYDQIKNKN